MHVLDAVIFAENLKKADLFASKGQNTGSWATELTMAFSCYALFVLPWPNQWLGCYEIESETRHCLAS